MPQTELERLHEEQGKVYQEMRSLSDLLENGDESQWNAEQRQKWDELNTQYDEFEERKKELENRQQVAHRMAELEERSNRQEFGRRTEVGESRSHRQGEITERDRELIMRSWLLANNGLELRQNMVDTCQRVQFDPHKAEFRGVFFPGCMVPTHGMWESRGRALMTDAKELLEERIAGWKEERDVTLGGTGANLVPEGFVNRLELAMLMFGGIRRVAQLLRTGTGNPLPYPTGDDTGNVGERLDEATDAGASVDPTFGQVVFGALKYSSKPVLISEEMLIDSSFNMQSVLAPMLGERIGRITNAEMTVTAVGGPGALDSTTNTVTLAGPGITPDDLHDMEAGIDPAYRMLSSVGYMFNDTTCRAIRKLKDTDGQYIWQRGLQAGDPDVINDYPYTINQDCPDLGTDGSLYFGAFEKFIVRDSGPARFYRLNERYREKDMTGFMLFSRHDSKYIQADAVAKSDHP